MWYKSITRVFLLTLAMAVCASAQFGPRDRSSSSTSDGPGSGRTVIRFMPSWTNTSAVMIIGGTETIMTSVKNYCGWFEARTTKPTGAFNIRFKQTIGSTYVGAEGNEEVVAGALPMMNEISLDSVAALSDTLWVQSFKNGEPEIFAEYPGILGPCPTRTISVMMFDWLHGNFGDGEFERSGGEKIWLGGNNAAKDSILDNYAYLISNDFGSGGCQSTGGKAMPGMVEPLLGANGVPKRNSSNFPADCHGTDYLDYWFLPLEIGEDASGKKYTNSTCRDLELELDKEGYWFGQKNSQSPERGLFFLDDFQYLDEAQTVPNIFYDRLNGSGGYHNFGFTMKFQAKFEYVRGQKFEFKGDDDVWVFINNRLVVDIGGQHAEVSGAVDLDTLGLTEGKEYPFHIFYVERHTSSSNFMMRTSMDLHTDASIFLTNDSLQTVATGQPWAIKNYDVWQITKGDALSCDFDANELAQIDTIEGPSNYRLTGGNLGEAGVRLDSIGRWFEGITLAPSWARFTIDTASIVENNGLAPGHYYLEVSLKSDPSQKTGVWFTIPPYKVPTLVFATERWQSLGPQVSGDTLQIGKWAYEKYKVQVMFLEDWAQVSIYNQNVTLTSSDPKMQIVDENGKPIGKVALDSSGRATFYVIANAPVSGVTLQAKGTASSASSWINLVFQEPPIPRISLAKIFDRNGDGKGDSVFIHFDRKLGGDNKLDSLQFAFGEGFPVQSTYDIHSNQTDISIVSSKTCEPKKHCGFSSLIFTGGKEGVYNGSVDTWFTYKEGGKSYHFHIAADPLTDGVNPIVMQAVKSITKNGHVLSLSFSEAITDSTRQFFKDMFRYVCVRAGAVVDPEKPIGADKGASNSKMDLLFTMTTVDAVIPSVGDSVGFVPGEGGSSVNVALDLNNNKPHKYTPMVRISGQQDMQITGTDVRPISADNPIIDTAGTTSPFLIPNTDVDAKHVADSLGVQGHLVGFDVAELIATQTADEIASLDALISTLLNAGKDDTTYTVTEITEEESAAQLIALIESGTITGFTDEAYQGVQDGSITADNYKKKLKGDDLALFEEYVQSGIEASRDSTMNITPAANKDVGKLFQDIIDGTISEKELKKAGVSEEVIEAIKKGTITANNIDQFRDGTLSLVKPDDVKLKYETFYYTHLGNYVGGSSGTILCSDKEVYGEEGCLVNTGNLFLAWNMRADDGRLAGTGVYIARLHMKVMVGKKTATDITRDLLWGVRRGGKNTLDLGAILKDGDNNKKKKKNRR